MSHQSFFKTNTKKKKSKWKIAKFSDKTKEAIFVRDWFRCIECWSDRLLTAHHCYYGRQSNRWDNRNEVTEWISLCAICHWVVHWCSVWIGLREKCINYLKNYYEKN